MAHEYLINLAAGLYPPLLAPLPAPDLQHLSVFSSRSDEGGRTRYRLHVGYFENERAARATLERVRAWYPAAWVVRGIPPCILARLPVSSLSPAVAQPGSDTVPVLIGLGTIGVLLGEPAMPLLPLSELLEGVPEASERAVIRSSFSVVTDIALLNAPEEEVNGPAVPKVCVAPVHPVAQKARAAPLTLNASIDAMSARHVAAPVPVATLALPDTPRTYNGDRAPPPRVPLSVTEWTQPPAVLAEPGRRPRSHAWFKRRIA